MDDESQAEKAEYIDETLLNLKEFIAYKLENIGNK